MGILQISYQVIENEVIHEGENDSFRLRRILDITGERGLVLRLYGEKDIFFDLTLGEKRGAKKERSAAKSKKPSTSGGKKSEGSRK